MSADMVIEGQGLDLFWMEVLSSQTLEEVAGKMEKILAESSMVGGLVIYLRHAPTCEPVDQNHPDAQLPTQAFEETLIDFVERNFARNDDPAHGEFPGYHTTMGGHVWSPNVACELYLLPKGWKESEGWPEPVSFASRLSQAHADSS